MAQEEATRIRPWLCHNCNLSSYLTIRRHRIDDVNSIQLWSCSNCGFKWKEIWSSYGRSLRSEQSYNMTDNDQKITA
jgi:hypothetical protein